MIKVQIDDAQVMTAFGRLTRQADNLLPLFQDIGEYLAESTRRRFATSTGPAGEKWAPNKPSTITRYLGKYKSSYTKTGAISKRGLTRSGAKKPLIGETHDLSRIYYHASVKRVEIGTSPVYSAVQQFGARKGAFGRGSYKSRRGSFPIPWGRIPPRPFLGISPADRTTILELIGRYLTPGPLS